VYPWVRLSRPNTIGTRILCIAAFSPILHAKQDQLCLIDFQ
jgi:hypothetical protein